MTSKLKQNIRFSKAQARLLKTVYPSNPIERKLVRLNEKFESLNKWSNMVWRTMHSNGYRAGVDNSNPAFYSYFDELRIIEQLKTKCMKSIETCEKKGISTEQALNTMYLINAGRASQSY